MTDSDPPRRSIRRRAAHWLGVGLVLLLLTAGLAMWALDTGPGHRFIADRVAALSPSSGLKIRIGRIDGSIYSRSTLRDVRLYDPQGLFLEVPELRLDWRPLSWMANRLDIRSAGTDLAILYRLPKLRPSTTKRKQILPGFDVRIDRLAVTRLRIEPPVTGTLHFARIFASADIRDGRAKAAINAISTARDQLKLALDAEPDRDDFDIDLILRAPSKGVIGAMIGTERPISASIAGQGSWTKWNGRALTYVSGNRIVDLALVANSGRYRLTGAFAPASITQGKLRRLSSPAIKVDGSATLVERQLTSRLSLQSEALDIRAAGVLDLAQSAFDRLRVDIKLLRPPALFPNMTGRDMRLHVDFNGPFASAEFDYELTAPFVAFDNTGFEQVKIVGKGNLSKPPIALPVAMTAAQVTGVGDVAGGILRNLKVNGVVNVTAKEARGQDINVSSDKLKGKLVLFLDLVTGRYEVSVSSSLSRYLIPGLGIVDVMTEVKVVPGQNGRGTHLEGRGRAWVRRFDNSFLRSLAGGLPQIETRLRRDADGIVHFVDLRLTAPDIQLRGTGYRRRDGTFYFDGSGSQSQYGPLDLVLDGDISRPKLDIALARPVDALRLQAVRLLLDPVSDGFAWRASGGSVIGPFEGNGRIILQPNSPALIAISALDVSGTRATGGLRVDPGGYTGKIVTSGGGIDGTISFNPVGGIQRIAPTLDFARAQLGGIVETRVGRGRVDGFMMLDPAGQTLEGTLEARGLRRRQLFFGRLSASAVLKAGDGQVKARLAGARGRAFDLQTVTDIDGGTIRISGGGTIDRKPVKLETPARITRSDDGWRLDQTRITFAGGQTQLAGRIGGSATDIEASVQRMPLSVLDVLAPDLAFGGYATGRFSYRQPRGGRLPVGDANLMIRGLTRSGLVLSSRPIDLGITARLGETAFAMRAIAVSDGKAIGRAQARIGALTPEGSIVERISRAPIFAQLRYNGPADTLWRLTGIEAIDLSGPIAIGADVTGVTNDPRIQGSLRSKGARLESAVTGTLVENVEATGRFGGSQLRIDDFKGTTPGGGAVTGTGVFDLAAVDGFGMDLSVQTQGAQILNRDDIAAIVTGPMTISSDGSGGTISGDLKILRGRFRLGRATAVAIPRLEVIERNRPGDQDDERMFKPWRLDIKADARNRLMVSGLGLDSEWRAELDIEGTVENPAITGRADLIRGGYEFAGRRFDLERGTIRFLGEAPPDPVLDISATASIQGLNAAIQVTGTGQQPEIRFSSVPALPEDELLSRLLFGTSITNLSAPEALQLAAAVASLRQGGGDGLNPINAVRRVAGLDRLRILP
ncbi:MAG: translocation/assembly module TamB domain-containing protein, partial [Sphingomonadaceae bacterium]